MITIAALEDQREWLEKEAEITKEYFDRERREYQFKKYNTASEFLKDFEEGHWADVYLLDVELPDTNGLKIARKIKQKHYEALIIYITGYVEYAVEAFEVNAYRYIPKIMLREKLPAAYSSLEQQLVSKEGPYYTIEMNARMERIEQKNIYYLQKEKKYVILTTKDGVSRVRATLEEVFGELQESSFVRIDKGCIANLRHIMKLEKREVKMREVKMRDGAYLPVSQPQLSTVKRRTAEYWRKSR